MVPPETLPNSVPRSRSIIPTPSACWTATFLMVEGAGRLDRVEISGDAAKLTVLKDGMNGPASVTQIGDTAWVLEGQLDLLLDPSKSGIKPDPFRAIAVPLK